ncbi:MAG: hypothetical protein OXL98_16580 [Acidimicrobiaceae bacterium]|nr:hypothetical protein [Acidimicrobiaceae bacterium]
MAYDPQRDQPRYRPSGNGSSVVDSLLDPAPAPPRPSQGEPPPTPGPGIASETPDAWSERLLCSAGISAVLGTAVGLVVLGLLWKARRRRAR